MRSEFAELVVAVRYSLTCEGGLQQPLRDDVGIASVWRRGMGVVADGEGEVIRMITTASDERILTATQELDHR